MQVGGAHLTITLLIAKNDIMLFSVKALISINNLFL